MSVVNLREIARLTGIQHEERTMLSPGELCEKLLLVLDATCRYCRQVSTEQLTHSQLDRPNRTFRSLGIHVIQMAAAFLDSIETGRVDLRGRPLTESAGESWSGPEIAAFGEAIRNEVANWWVEAGRRLVMDQLIENNWGITTLHHTMER